LHRSVIAFDINDEKMLASSLTLDATFSMMGVTHDGYDAIKTNILDNVGPLDTTHFISNVRVSSSRYEQIVVSHMLIAPLSYRSITKRVVRPRT
jgi:hypothetical protein